jgi:hypothetical protein
LAGVLCCGALALLIAVGKVPPLDGQSWIAQPLPMQCAAAAAALFGAGVAGAWLARRVGFWGFWTATALFSAGASVVCAVMAAGASFLFLLPAGAAALGGLAVIPVRPPRVAPAWAAEFAAVLPVLGMCGTLLPVVRFLYVALGSVAWPLSALLLGVGAATLLPLLDAAGPGARRMVIGAAGLTVVGGTLMTLALPTYSAEWPERVNLEYWLDTDTGAAHYLAQCASLRLPASLAAAARFDPRPRPRFPGSGLLGFYAPAPTLALAPPELSSLPEPLHHSPPSPPVGSPRAAHFDVLLRSARGAPEAILVFPAQSQVDEVTVWTDAGPVAAKLYPLTSGATLLDIVALPPAGLELSFEAAGSLPPAIQLFDQSFDFPAPGALQRARPLQAASSQDGDITAVHRTVSPDPAAGR